MPSEWDRGRESVWGPRGLETPTSVPDARLLALAGFSLLVVIGVPWCQQNFGYIDLDTGNRGCGAAQSEIRVWAFEYYTRRPEDVVILQQWIARHPRRINKQYGAFCDTPLHFAARFGREDLADPLIAAGADVEARNKLDERPLHTSATHGRPAVVQLLLARGADVDAIGPGGKTPLHAAAFGLGGQSKSEARIEVAKLLLAAGANVNARESGSGFMPLRYATSSASGNTMMAALLLSHGADPRGAEEQASAPPTRAR
jgi:ankyrin repeat protein